MTKNPSELTTPFTRLYGFRIVDNDYHRSIGDGFRIAYENRKPIWAGDMHGRKYGFIFSKSGNAFQHYPDAPWYGGNHWMIGGKRFNAKQKDEGMALFLRMFPKWETESVFDYFDWAEAIELNHLKRSRYDP